MLCKILLLALALLSYFAKNRNMSIAALVMLGVSLSNNEKSMAFIENYFLDIGMIFLMMWMLVPLIKPGSSFTTDMKSILNFNGIVAFLSGVFVAVLAAKGVTFLKGSVDVLTGVIIGSIIGIAALGGVPVGPLIASGIAYETVRFINFIFKHFH